MKTSLHSFSTEHSSSSNVCRMFVKRYLIWYTLRKICQHKGFHWRVFSRISIILSLNEKILVRENPYSGVFCAVIFWSYLDFFSVLSWIIYIFYSRKNFEKAYRYTSNMEEKHNNSALKENRILNERICCDTVVDYCLFHLVTS